MKRRSFLKALGALVAAPAVEVTRPKRRRRLCVPTRGNDAPRLGYGTWSWTPTDSVRCLYDDEPVPDGWRVVKDEWR